MYKSLNLWFESFVNSERCKTTPLQLILLCLFESFVNSERCKTSEHGGYKLFGLRALLIQKDVKLQCLYELYLTGLRALLIQKDVKLLPLPSCVHFSLRALLIQKDVKPLQQLPNLPLV